MMSLAPVARIEAIRLFLAYASFKDFMVYQMDVKSVFLYGNIEEEVYVCQPLGFEDPDFPDRVYKVEKALFGLHQALRARYETLSTYLLDNEFQREKIDKTLFIKRYKCDILLVQVYVDDIIFGSTKKELCNAFEKLMHEKFQMSSMGELTFFLGLQVQQKKDGIFISQDKYVGEILKKFGFSEVKTASTPMETQKPLLKDEDGKEVDVNMYRSMIGSLMYLTSSRPDIMFAVCACARYQVNPKVSHLHAMKRIFSVVKTINEEVQLHALVDDKKIIISEASVRRHLKLEDEENINCLPNSIIFEQLALIGYEKISQKLTFYKPLFSPQWKFLIHTVLQCLSPKTTAWNEFSNTMASAIICLATNQKFSFSKFIFESMIRNLESVSGKFLMYLRFVQVFLDKQLDGMSTHNGIYIAPSHTKKIFGNMRRVGKGFSGRVTPLFPTMVVQNQAELGEDEAVHKELGDSLVRAVTTASSLEAEHDSGNITKTRSKATPNKYSFLGTSSGGGPRCQETMGDTIAQTRFENVSKLSNDSLLTIGNTLQSDEDRLKFNELMELSTNLQKNVLDLEKIKTTKANEIASLKRRVKKLG
ncbi:putative ribonuclease H-like domain-containing protein [Tanacetum coccineum]|uniref:Ribonuclease H-like domain-containing protein n=1 Tax=Tanacetum coccineum TaxID=301880 RepID=A0ABQ5FER5_9ASTR